MPTVKVLMIALVLATMLLQQMTEVITMRTLMTMNKRIDNTNGDEKNSYENDGNGDVEKYVTGE